MSAGAQAWPLVLMSFDGGETGESGGQSYRLAALDDLGEVSAGLRAEMASGEALPWASFEDRQAGFRAVADPACKQWVSGAPFVGPAHLVLCVFEREDGRALPERVRGLTCWPRPPAAFRIDGEGCEGQRKAAAATIRERLALKRLLPFRCLADRDGWLNTAGAVLDDPQRVDALARIGAAPYFGEGL